jgi:hypothetical protein
LAQSALPFKVSFAQF